MLRGVTIHQVIQYTDFISIFQKVGHPSIELKTTGARERNGRVSSIHSARQWKPQFITLKAITERPLFVYLVGIKSNS